jgi:hypothetical protein
MQYRVGIDIGGTFTDFIADEANRQLNRRILDHESDRKRDDRSQSVLKLGVIIVRLSSGKPRSKQGRGGAYLTTRGFRDAVISRGNRQMLRSPWSEAKAVRQAPQCTFR